METDFYVSLSNTDGAIFPPCAAKQSHCSSNHPNLADHLLKNATFWLLSERRDWKGLAGNCRIGMCGHVPKLGSFETVRFKLLISGEKMCLTVPLSLFILPVVKCWSSTQCWGGFENPVDAFKLRSGEMAWSRNVMSWVEDTNVTVTTASSSLPLFCELLPSAVVLLTSQHVVGGLKFLLPHAGIVLVACLFFISVSLSGSPQLQQAFCQDYNNKDRIRIE